MPDTYDFTGNLVTLVGFFGVLSSFLVIYTALAYFNKVNN